MIECFNHALKERQDKNFTELGHQKWVSLIQDIVNNYNTVHFSTKSKRSEACIKLVHEKEINLRKAKFKTGDVERIYWWKSHFEKVYTKRSIRSIN